MKTITQTSGACYRTKPMLFNRAHAFEGCLTRNPAFTAVRVVELKRRDDLGRRLWCVEYLPVSQERRDLIRERYQAERETRAMHQGSGYQIIPDPTNGPRFAYVLSSSGHVYEVEPSRCSCPDWQYRCQPAELQCKHQILWGWFRCDDLAARLAKVADRVGAEVTL